MIKMDNGSSQHKLVPFLSWIHFGLFFVKHRAIHLFERIRFNMFVAKTSLKLRSTSKKLHVGKDVFIHDGSDISATLYVGDGTRINGPAKIKGHETVRIGNYCAIGDNLRIISTNHKMNYADVQTGLQEMLGIKWADKSKGPIEIGNNVWIGDSVTILPGAKISDGAVIGACSVVTKTIPPFSVAVGIPAKPIKKRFSEEVIKKLLEIRWWDWPLNKIKRNKEFFEIELNNINVNKIDGLIKN